MASPSQLVPSLSEFQATCRDAFGYLKGFGFVEVPPPSHRREDPFQVWFRADDRLVIARGEGYGTSASVSLEHASGVHLDPIWLVPAALRPNRRAKHFKAPGQLEIIRTCAARLLAHGADFLRGDLTQFLSLAKPLPAYLRQGDV
jgi:hypothetical protein